MANSNHIELQKKQRAYFYLLANNLYQIIQTEREFNSGHIENMSDDFYDYISKMNHCYFKILKKSLFKDFLSDFERKLQNSPNKIPCFLLKKEAILMYAIALAICKYLDMSIKSRNGGSGYDDYLNNKKNKFKQTLTEIDERKEKTGQVSIHTFKESDFIQSSSFTTKQFQGLLDYYNRKRAKSKIDPNIVAKDFAAIFNAYLILNMENKDKAIKMLASFLSAMFYNLQWEQDKAYTYAKDAFDSVMRLP